MKIAVLLLHESHFAQAARIIKKYHPDNIILIPLDIYSLRSTEKSGYPFIIPEYKDKVMIRNKLFGRMPSIIKAWGEAYVKKAKLEEYLKVNDFDLWDILKAEVGIQLFDKLYFIELIKFVLLRSGADYLMVPKYPSTIKLFFLATIDYITIKRLAESINMPVLN